MDGWMKEHHEKDCYPPTIIHITDGEFNHSTKETVIQKANELKAMFTNDGNVVLFNIHFTANLNANSVACPIEKVNWVVMRMLRRFLTCRVYCQNDIIKILRDV